MDLVVRALERFEGWPKGVLECSRAQLLRYLGREDEAARVQLLVDQGSPSDASA